MYGYIVKHICQRDHLLSRTSLEDFFSSSKFGFFCFQPLPQFSRQRYFKFDWVVAHRCKLCTFYNGNVSETSVIVAKKLNFQIFKLYLHTSILDLWNLIKKYANLLSLCTFYYVSHLHFHTIQFNVLNILHRRKILYSNGMPLRNWYLYFYDKSKKRYDESISSFNITKSHY